MSVFSCYNFIMARWLEVKRAPRITSAALSFCVPAERKIKVKTEKVKISDMNPAPYHPRKDLQPGDPAYDALQNSVNEFGCVQAIVWNKRTGNVVGGHQLLKVLIARGDTEAECSVVDLDLDREQALNIALNEIRGERDNDKLAALLREIKAADPGLLKLTGIAEREMERLMGEAEQAMAEIGEVSADEFAEEAFTHKCPRCGYCFDD